MFSLMRQIVRHRPLRLILVVATFICAALFFHAALKPPAGELTNGQPITLDVEPEPGLFAYQLNEKSFGPKTLSIIQSDSGVSLPSGSRGLRFVYAPPIDPSWAAKIEIPKEAVPSLLARLSRTPDVKVNISGEMGPRMTWWRAEDANILIDRQSEPMGNYLRTTLTDEEGVTILYIEWAVF